MEEGEEPVVQGRPTTLATEGMVATPHYLATVAGLRVLQSGGNAVDAAIAANAVLTVVYPHMCAIGGDAFFLIWEPGEGRLHALNGSGRSPATATIDAMRAAGHSTMPQRGAGAVTVPGTVHAWETVLERFGTRGFADLLLPAISYAERGFPVSPRLAKGIETGRALLEQQPAAARQFMPNGRPPRVGEILRQPELGASLRLIAGRGAAALYQGALGEAIVSTVQARGGLLAAEDLAAHRSDWIEPIRTTYRGVELVELPPNTQGIAAIQMANITEGFDVAAMGAGSTALVHHMVEAKKFAIADRDRYICDPESFDIPLERLLSAEYAAELRARIDPQRANNGPFDPPGGGDTVYLCVVDRDGLAVSLIQSIFNGFGSGLVAEGTGIVLQNRGASFQLDPQAANHLAPGKRPMHTLIPAMLMRDGLPWVVFGTMGGHGQAQTHLQLLSNLVDFGMTPQEAIEAPRWVSGRGNENDPPHVLYLEPGFGEEVLAELRAMDHDARFCEPFSSLMGHANMIQIDREHGILMGASDPRADGYALGW